MHIRASRGDIAERVLVAGDPGRIDLISSLLSDAKLVNTHRGFIVYTGYYNGVPVSLASHGVGGPSAAIVFEELVILGAKIIVRLGTCGSLLGDIGLGELIIPTGASYYLGGLYYQYMGESACAPTTPHYEVLKSLVEEATRANARYHVGPVVSSDAFYAESRDFALKWSSRGVIAVEMECATLFMLGHMRRVKTGALLVVSDNLVTGVHASSEELRDTVLKAARIALNAVAKVTP